MSIFDQLNLRPQERRVLVVVLFAVFVVINIYFVRPIFGEWGRVKQDLDKSKATLAGYKEEIAKAPANEKLEAELKSSGSDVLTQELELNRIVSRQAVSSGVQVGTTRAGAGGTGRTNQFFEEQTLTIDFNNTGARELVEFLIGLASGNSMVRVREMSVRHDPSRTRLVGHLIFVASFQKKTPAPTATAASVARPTTAPAARPASTQPAKSTAPATNTAAVAANTNAIPKHKIPTKEELLKARAAKEAKK